MLLEKGLLGKAQSIEWLYKFCESYERWNEIYIEKIDKVVKKEIILPNYDVVENRVLIYEILGYLASYANYLLDIKEERANEVLNYIVGLINEYEYFVYAPYDVSVNVMIMIYKLLYHFKRKDEIGYLIEHQTETIKLYFELYKKISGPLQIHLKKQWR